MQYVFQNICLPRNFPFSPQSKFKGNNFRNFLNVIICRYVHWSHWITYYFYHKRHRSSSAWETQCKHFGIYRHMWITCIFHGIYLTICSLHWNEEESDVKLSFWKIDNIHMKSNNVSIHAHWKCVLCVNLYVFIAGCHIDLQSVKEPRGSLNAAMNVAPVCCHKWCNIQENLFFKRQNSSIAKARGRIWL